MEKRAARLRATSAAALGARVSASTVASMTSWTISRRAPSKDPLPATSTSFNEPIGSVLDFSSNELIGSVLDRIGFGFSVRPEDG